jgi:3-oxoacyl-(acyl-carrier-protein) synthase
MPWHWHTCYRPFDKNRVGIISGAGVELSILMMNVVEW